MLRFFAWISAIMVGLGMIALVAGWLLLQSSVFSDYRRNLVQSALSEQIGQPLIINDDVRMQTRRYSTVFIGGVVIPSENIEDTKLAELETASFQLDLFKLFAGEFHIDNLEISKLHVNLITTEDRSTSWTKEDVWGRSNAALSDSVEHSEEGQSPESEVEGKGDDEPAGSDAVSIADAPQTGFFRFLRDKTANVSDIQLIIDNKWTGFQFSFLLKTLKLEQLQGGAVVSLSSDGTVNDRPFEIAGTFPKGEPFNASARFGGTALKIDGVPFPEENGDGYTANASLDTGSLGDLLEAIGLQRSFDGSGKLTTRIEASPSALEIADLEAAIALDKGQMLSISGGAENVLKLASVEAGVDLTVNFRLLPADKLIERARKIADIRLIEIDGRIISAGEGVELENLQVETNAFAQDLRNIGPVSITRVHRTEAGELSLSGVDIQIGPKGRPVIRANGNVRDIFQFQGVEFEGRIAAPADLLLTRLEPESVAKFGSINGEFSISDAAGHIAVTNFKGYSQDSDLWSLDTELSVVDVANLTDVIFRFDLGIADSAQFLSALNLEPVDAGRLAFSGRMEGDKLDLTSNYDVLIDQSRIGLALESRLQDDDLIIRGSMQSDEIHIADLRDVVSAGLQLRSLVTGSGSSQTEVLPLVIEQSENEAPEQKKGPDSDTEVLPLVIEEDADLVSGERLLERLDLVFNIDIRKIVGQEGVSGVKSDLVLKKGKMEFGPLEAAYGGGFFKVSAAMDLLKSREVVRVSGSTGGWDFGEILDSVGLGMEAYGTLGGNFDLTGNISSLKTFANTMGGNVTVRMTNGRISTSLLELAGLGIFRWLFSEERRQGFTNIVCINAPVRLNAGRVSSGAVVAETERVQVVVSGQANWLKDTVALRGEPRPVGKPLGRSAFPFEVKGRLSNPDFKIRFAGIPAEFGHWAPRRAAAKEGRVPCVPDRNQANRQ